MTASPSPQRRLIRHVLPVLALLGLVLVLSGAAMAEQRLDLAALQPLPPLAELVVHGTNTTAQVQHLVVRVDDRPSPPYADRANEERVVPPGPFVLRLRLASLRTPRGRMLQPARMLGVIVFAPQGGITLQPLVLQPPPSLPTGTYGWFFGPADAVPLAGFRAVSLTDPAVSGPALREVHRPNQDPVLAWGMHLTRFAATLPPGRWHFTLWTEDPGAWETLPKVLERRIRLNGKDLLLERHTDAEWVQTRYLAGRNVEADPAKPPFATLGARRGGRVDADMTLPDGHFVLELAGYPQAATNLSVLTAAPADRPLAAVDAVEALRAARFAENWPVLSRAPWTGKPDTIGKLAIDGQASAVTAPGGLAIFRLQVHAPQAATAQATLQAGSGDRLLWGMWRWRRPAPDVPALELSAAHLRGDSAEIPLRTDLPRPLVVLAPVPADAKPGTRTLQLTLVTPTARVEKTLTLHVLGVHRPAPRARVGAFLDFAPHLAYDPAAARRQAACDLDTLRGLGLTAVAPPLATPGDDLAPFLADLRAAAARFAPPLVAYAPARRLDWQHGPAGAATLVAKADAAARAAGLPEPVWTVADEPSAAGTFDQAMALIRQIRLADRNAALAGHLNDPADSRILQQLNLVTVNPRFGVDAGTIARITAPDRQVWLYNMPHARLAAGFYLWRSGAAGLLQWHARMPTADAFDPTDGREGDVQFLWPTPQVCGAPDLDTELLSLADGEEDLRWLAWLQAAAQQDKPGAAALLQHLRNAVPDTWQAARHLPDGAPAEWRARIVALARHLGDDGRDPR